MKTELLNRGFKIVGSCMCGGTLVEEFIYRNFGTKPVGPYPGRPDLKPYRINLYPYRRRFAVKKSGLFIKAGNNYEMDKALKDLGIFKD